MRSMRQGYGPSDLGLRGHAVWGTRPTTVGDAVALCKPALALGRSEDRVIEIEKAPRLMNLTPLTASLLLASAVGCLRAAVGNDSKPNPGRQGGVSLLSRGTAPQAYHVRAGGVSSFVGLTNAAASNRVAIRLARVTDEGAIFRLTNRELHTVLLWNVRVQTKSKGGGTDGFGWDTVQDDYPVITAKYNSAKVLSGDVSEVRVQSPEKSPWRVCVLYSIDWTDSGKICSGNYEAISEELNE